MKCIYFVLLLPAAVICASTVQWAEILKRKTKVESDVRSGYDFNDYQPYEKIESYLRNIEDTHGDLVTLEAIGETYENRSLLLVKIDSGKHDIDGQTTPAIWIDAGVHAREWIAPAAAMRLIKEFVENYHQNKELVDRFVWYILPMANPDGYSYSWTQNRNWRKNRSPGVSCDGVDLNRNFDMFWNEEGSSRDECSDTYSGKKPFTERETVAMRDFILKERQHIRAYFSLHSYGQLILFPWGVGSLKHPRYNKLKTLATRGSNAIKEATGKLYEPGQVTEIMYAAGGCSDDWAIGRANISLAFTFELRNQNSFQIPKSEIDPVFRELFAALQTMLTSLQ